MNNSSISETTNSTGHFPRDTLSSEAAAVCYAVIFVLALLGNILVIATLVQNKRMRTVTNVFLLNLAFSDLLLALFCMPFNIIPMLMRNFVFGPSVCYLSRYFQGQYNLWKEWYICLNILTSFFPTHLRSTNFIPPKKPVLFVCVWDFEKYSRPCIHDLKTGSLKIKSRVFKWGNYYNEESQNHVLRKMKMILNLNEKPIITGEYRCL